MLKHRICSCEPEERCVFDISLLCKVLCPLGPRRRGSQLGRVLGQGGHICEPGGIRTPGVKMSLGVGEVRRKDLSTISAPRYSCELDGRYQPIF